MQPVILPSARRHGVADEDMLHALTFTNRLHADQGNAELTMAIGPARNGVTVLEVGYLTDDNGRLIVVHAMKARRKYL